MAGFSGAWRLSTKRSIVESPAEDIPSMRFPITLYKEDPETNRLAEYHEVKYALDSKAGGFALLDLHGWWENEKGTAYLNRRVLYEPQKSEQDASSAMDARVAWLEENGWKYKFTGDFDPYTGMLRMVRIP
jgi:hypothetical protein